MKVPPKRKGNRYGFHPNQEREYASMKVPPKRKGNFAVPSAYWYAVCLNESPSEKEGKCFTSGRVTVRLHASMKVPPKRKGNLKTINALEKINKRRLNESPSEKEGK